MMMEAHLILGCRRSAIIIFSILMVSMLNIPNAAASEDLPWPTFRGDPSGTGVSDSRLSEDIVEYWSFTADERITSTPVLSSEHVYFGTTAGTLYCLNREDGKKVWSVKEESSIEASPALSSENVLYGTTDGIARLLVSSTGEQIWSHEVGGPIHASCGLVEHSALIASDDGSLVALEESNGTVRWSFSTGYYVYSMPAIWEGRMYFGSCDQKLYCLDFETGTELWNHSSGYVTSTPALSNGLVYFGAYDSNIYCLDALSGMQKWKHPAGDSVYSSAAVYDDRLYVGIQDGTVLCVDADDGTEVWSYPTNGTVNSSPVVADGKVIVGSGDGNLYIFDATDGEVILKFQTGDEISGSAAIASGRIYFGSSDGVLYCLGEEVLDMTMDVLTEAQYITSSESMNITVKVTGPSGPIQDATVNFKPEVGQVEPQSTKTNDEGEAVARLLTPRLNSSTVEKITITVTKDGYREARESINILLLPYEGTDVGALSITFLSLPENVSSNQSFGVSIKVSREGGEPVANISLVVSIGETTWFGTTDEEGIASLEITAPYHVDDFILKVEVPSQVGAVKEVVIPIVEEVEGPPHDGSGDTGPDDDNGTDVGDDEGSKAFYEEPLLWILIVVVVCVIISFLVLRRRGQG